MLQNIHDRAQGWLAWIIVGLICIPFALWGIQEYFGGGGEVVVAEVNGADIELAEFQRNYQRYRQQIEAVFGDALGRDPRSEEGLKQRALNQMVEALLKQQVGLETRMRISDAQVANKVRSMEAFQRDGKFAQDLYERQLQGAALTPSTFEEQLRRELLNEQLQDALEGSVFITRFELEGAARLQGQKRQLSYLVLPAQAAEATVEIAAPEVERYYQDHRDAYTTPERVKLAYLDLSLDKIAKQVTIDEAALRKHYDHHAGSYTVPEQRRAHHILVKLSKDADEAQIEAARKKAEGLVERVRKGESFEDLARKESEDLGSKAQGGDLGFFQRGAMVAPFEAAVFAMKAGAISDTVRSDFGFHIIRLDEVTEEKVKSFEEAKDEVLEAYRREQAEQRFFDLAEQMAELAYEHPDTLEVAGEKLGLPIQESEPFGREGGTGVAAQGKVVDAAFSPEVLEEGRNSEPLELDENRFVVVRVKEHKRATLRTLAEVRDEVVKAIKSARAKRLATERGEALMERLRGGEDRLALAQKEGLKWSEPEALAREEGKVDRAIVRSAFQLPRPGAGSASFGGVSLANGDYAVVALLSVKDPDPPLADKEAEDRLKEALLASRGAREWQDFIAELRRSAEISIHSENL